MPQGPQVLLVLPRPVTGAVDYGWAYLPKSNKWVYYDPVTGRMWYGSVMIDGKPYYLDEHTGEKLSHDTLVKRLIDVAASQNGQVSADKYVNALKAAGGNIDPAGPCLTYVWWCYQEAGLHYQFANGELATGYPHELLEWQKAHGQLVHSNPRPGDIWYVRQPYFAPEGMKDVSATHAGIIAAVRGNVADVWEHVNGRVHLVHERLDKDPWQGTIVGFGRLSYND